MTALRPPRSGEVPPPPTSRPDSLEAEVRSSIFLTAMIVLLVIFVLLFIPTSFDWVGKNMTAELNGKLDLVTGALLTVFGDLIRRAATTKEAKENQ